MLLATSCLNEKLDPANSDNEAQVTFSLTTEGNLATKAISDGTGAKKLIYAVYNAKGQLIETINGADINGQFIKHDAFQGGLNDEVTITLAKGQQYTVAFWAQNPDCKAYNTTDLTNVTVDYAGLNNDETRDAFFKAETFTVSGNAEIDVVLKRPFAQINVGVYQSDWNAAVASQIEIEKSKVTIDDAATSINLLTGAVDGKQTVEYGFATIPAQFTSPEKLKVDLNNDGTKEEYIYLSMSYILANDNTTGYAKTTLNDLDFIFAPKSGNNINLSQGLTAVPVQRNWRTNIIGTFLTGKITFNITIDPIYDGDYNNGEAQPVNINGVYYPTIQAAVNAVKTGEVIKVATGEYSEVVNVTGGKKFTLEAAGPDVVIAGIDHQSNGTPSTVTVKGITIDNSINANGWFTGTSQNMSTCVGAWGGDLKFVDCKFIVAGTSGRETGVMTWWTTDDMSLTFDNCTFEGKNGHASARAMQIYGNVNMEVSNCTFNTKKDYTLKYVAEDDNVATFTNNTVNNSENFVELGSSVYPGSNYTVNINNNTLGAGVNTHVIANPENQIVNVSGNVQVIAEGLVKDGNGNYIASSKNGIINAIYANIPEIQLVDGSYDMPDSFHDSINLKGKTLTIKGNKDVIIEAAHIDERDQFVTDATLKFEGVTLNFGTANYMGFANCSSLTYKDCAINGLQFAYGAGHTVFENCDLNSNGAEHCLWTWGGQNISFTGCDFTYGDRAVNCYGENVTTNVSFTDCTFTKVPGKATTGAIETNSSALTALYLTINNCTVNEGDLWWISTWDSKKGANTYATVDGKVATSAAIQTAINNGTTNIELTAGTYTIPAAAKNKTLTISGTADTKIDITNGLTYVNGADITFEGVTIQSKPNGAGYENGFADLKKAKFNNCIIDGTIGLDFTCEFNKCVFNIEGNYYNVWTWGAGTATFKECTFNCDGKALLVYANVLDNGTYHQTVNITDCTFNDNGDDTVTGKAAIEITNTYTPIRTYDVIIKNTTVNGFTQTVPGTGDFNAAYGSVDNGNIGTNVWGNKCKLSSNYLNVVIDGVDVY